MQTRKMTRLELLKSRLMSLLYAVIGIPTPYGRINPRAFMALQAMSKDLQMLQVNYDYALAKNTAQANQIEELRGKVQDIHKDAVQMSKALKELANHPNVLSSESQKIVSAFKIKTH
jgi:predicted lipoprotein